MMEQAYAVILAGGKGERFWPLSTSRRPKQVLRLVGDRPMLAQAIERLRGLIPVERVLVITGSDLVDVIREAVPELPAANVIGEPCGRDTAAAVALGAALVRARAPEGVMAVLTADHVIADGAAFRRALEAGLRAASASEVLITMGIPPTFPSTGFGYIEAGEALSAWGGVPLHRVRRFVEKPDAARAAAYLAEGHYFWNSGMFVWSVGSIVAALARYCPPLAAMMEALGPDIGQPTFEAALGRAYGRLERISVDYAILEKAGNLVMVKGAFDWDDVGSWPALEHHFAADGAGNVVIGDGEVLDSAGNIVYSEGRLTALIGVQDLVVVQAEGVTLVCAKDRAQEVKRMVQRLAGRGDCAALL